MNKQFKRIASFVIAVMMLLISIPMVISAYETPTYVSGVYPYECVSSLPDLTNETVVMDAFNNDAIDSYNQDKMTANADDAAVCLKFTFNPPRTHLTLGFRTEIAGTYKIAIKYKAGYNASFNRTIVAQVDDMGTEQFPVTMGSELNYLILTVELPAGEHTLTLHAPKNLDEKDENGKKYQSCDLYSYHAWLVPEAETEPIDVKGYQTAADSENINLRVVYGLNSITEWNKIGMEIDVTGKATVQKTVETTTVYSAVLANKEDGSGSEAVTADSLDAAALAVLVLKMELTGTYNITVKSYTVDAEGIKHYGTSITLTVIDGAVEQA